MKRTRFFGLLAIAAVIAAMTGCRSTAPENGNEITTESVGITEENTEAEQEAEADGEAEDIPVTVELTGIDDNLIYIYPSSDQMTPQEVAVTAEEAEEIIGFVNAVEKTSGTIANDSNIYFKNGDVSVNIASYDSSVNMADVSGVLTEADTTRLIEIIKTESGIDLSAYLD